ncbi:MAG: AsmA family protein [Ignavibacteria bacterium]|nr:AsmA family protein [Ignavibacteria bacterium]
MALSRKGKIWLIILAVPVVLIIGAAITLKILFTSDRLKAIIIPRVEEAMNRSVAVNDISLSLFPSIAIVIESLSISNRTGSGFSDQPLLTLDRLVLDVQLAPLLKGSLEVPTVLLERPRLFLEINEEGIANYTTDEEQWRAPLDTGQVLDTAVVTFEGRFLLSNLQIIDGAVEYIDRRENSAIHIEGLNQTVRIEVVPVVDEVRIESQTSIDKFSYGNVTTPLVSNLRMTLTQELLYDRQKDLLTIQKGEGTFQDMVLAVKGTISSLSTAPTMDLAIESNNINIAELISIVPREYMKKAEGLQGEGTARVKLTIKGVVSDSTQPDIAGSISATDASVQYASLPKRITNVNIVSEFTRTSRKQEFRVTKFSANLGGNPLSATLRVVNFDDPSLTMAVNASLNLAEVKDYYPLEVGTELTGLLKAKVDIAGKISNPHAMKVSGLLDFQGVTIKTAASEKPAQNLNGKVTFSNEILDARKLSMTVGRSDLSLAFRMSNYLSMMSDDKSAPKPAANVVLTSNHLYTADIMTDESKTKTSTATQSRPESKQPEKSFTRVPLPNVDMDISATIGTLTMEKFELTNVRGNMTISNGIINLQNFSFNIFDGSIATKGALNLQKPEEPSFDLAMDMKNVDAHSMLPNFTTFGERMYGRLSMNTTLKGTLDDTLGLDPQSLYGRGTVHVAKGKLTGVKVNQVIARLLKLPDLEEIEFNDWSNAYTIADGRIYIKGLRISALDADYIVNGSQGLDGSLDYTMSLVLPKKTSAKISVPGFASRAIDLFKDESGRVKLDFSVSGTTDDPKVALDTEAAQKKAKDLAKQKIADEVKKLEEKLKEKGKEILKGLFKKKKP